MANGATNAGLRCRDGNGFADSRGSIVEENGESPRVKILLRPGDELAALFTSPTVAAGRATTDRADKFRTGFARLSGPVREMNGPDPYQQAKAKARHARESNIPSPEHSTLKARDPDQGQWVQDFHRLRSGFA